MKTDKYHPIDVRYRGPSTAYRGSAHGKPKLDPAPTASTPKATAPQHPTAARAAPQAGPWSAASPKATPAQEAALRNAARAALGPTTKRPTRLQWVLIAFVAYLVLSSLPGILTDSMSLAPTQMRSISDP